MFLRNFLFPLTIGSILLSHAMGDSTCKHKMIGSGVSQEDKDVILRKHNTLRISIARGRIQKQPKGTNMQNLTWDDSLAAEAQNIANTCVYAHVKVKDNRWEVGQNLYTQQSSEPGAKTDWDRGIQMWFDEFKMYDYGPFDFCNMNAGHYTQVVWAETKYVGCGYTFFEKGGHMSYQKLYVCNYGPGGNVLGEYPYKTKN